MPIYDYQCRRCRLRFELLVRPGDVPACPGCGAADPDRQFPTSAAVSTTRTRGRSLAIARGKASAAKKEKDHAHAEYLRNHERDHS
jgi:putative FmdB family regulatory protein